MTYDDLKVTVGRKRCQLVELQCDYCALVYGTAPCTASVGVTGAQKCFNTRKTCQDPANYSPTTKSYVFSDQPVLLPPQGQMIIVAGQGGESAISFDGDTYSLPPAPPASLHFMSISTTGGGFSLNLTISDDNTSWAAQSTPIGTQAPYALNFCNGFWFIGSVVGNAFGSDAALSTDGSSWTALTIPFTGSSSYQGFAFVNTTYFVWAANPAQYATSPNGVTWTTQTPPMYANFRWIAFGGAVYVCVGEQAPNFSQFFHSADGISWTVGITSPPRVDFAVVKIVYAAGPGLFVGIGYRGGSGEGTIWTSPDGINWTFRANPWVQLSGLCSVAYGNGIWLVAGANIGMMTSPDAITWTLQSGPPIVGGHVNITDIAFNAGVFYCAGGDSRVWETTDGVTWGANYDSARVGNPIYRIAVRP